MKKKIIKTAVTVIIFVLLTAVCASAIDSNIDAYDDSVDYDEMISSVDGETAEILAELGIDSLSFDKMLSVSPAKVIYVLFGVFTGGLVKPFSVMLTIIGITLLTVYVSELTRSADTVSLVGSSAAALVLLLPLSETLSAAFSVLETVSAFSVSFSGVLCALLSASGNTALGISYGTFAAFLCSFISLLTESVSAPLIGGVSALTFLSCFNIYTLTEKTALLIKRVYIFVLGALSTVFAGLISVKSLLSSSADSVALRSVKYIVGRSVPIVGGAVSETYSAVAASLSLIKSTVGVFGIITVFITVLPVTAEILSWMVAVSVSSALAEAFGGAKIAQLLASVKDVLTLILATVLFSAVVFTVGAGVVISVRGALS